MQKFDSYSPQDTYRWASELAKNAKAGDIYTLSGDLGAGKTLFAGGFAAGLRISSHVVSPTFTILSIYDDGVLPLYHFDMYRIEDVSELVNIGHEEYFYGDGVCLIEWPEMVAEAIPESAVKIRIEKDPAKGDDYRCITISNMRGHS